MVKLRLLHTMPGWLDAGLRTSHFFGKLIGAASGAVAYLDLVRLEARKDLVQTHFSGLLN